MTDNIQSMEVSGYLCTLTSAGLVGIESSRNIYVPTSPFDDLRSQPSSPPLTPVQSELIALLRALRIPPPAPLRDSPPNRFDYSNANMRDQNSRPTLYRGIHCHNCWEEGHYSTSCTKPVVSEAQREANRRVIDELQGGPRQYTRGPGVVPGLPPPQSALAVLASAGVGRRQRMNNIGMANVVILKRPREGEVKNEEVDHIAATTKRQKLEPTRISEAEKFRLTSLVTEPLAQRIALIPSLFL